VRAGLSNLFDPYNLYAKAFPGIVFFILAVSLLPKGSLAEVGTSGSLVAAFVLLIIVLGFVFGQVIHSVSGFIESGIYTTLRDYYRVFSRIRGLSVEIGGNTFTLSRGVEENTKPELSKFQLVRLVSFPALVIFISIISWSIYPIIAFLFGLLTNIFGPLERIRSRFRPVLTPHRDLFIERISNEDDLVCSFKKEVNESFDFTSGDSTESLYIAAMSRLEFAQTGRANTFQAIFSFSRSLWIILLFYSTWYILIGITVSTPKFLPESVNTAITAVSNYDPVISNIVGSGSGMILLGIGMIISCLLFFRSEGKYKHLFVEYVLVDYLSLQTFD